jgi:hypothetical protein
MRSTLNFVSRFDGPSPHSTYAARPEEASLAMLRARHHQSDRMERCVPGCGTATQSKRIGSSLPKLLSYAFKT